MPDPIEALILGQQPASRAVSPASFPRETPEQYSDAMSRRAKILQSEMSDLEKALADARKNNRTADVASIQRDIGILQQDIAKSTGAPSVSATDPIEALISGTPSTTPTGEMRLPRLPREPSLKARADEGEESILNKISKKLFEQVGRQVGTAEAALATVGVPASMIVSAGQAIPRSIVSGIAQGKAPGTFLDEYTKQGLEKTLPFVLPKTEQGQQILSAIGEFINPITEATKLPPVLTPELMALQAAQVGAGTQAANIARRATAPAVSVEPPRVLPTQPNLASTDVPAVLRKQLEARQAAAATQPTPAAAPIAAAPAAAVEPAAGRVNAGAAAVPEIVAIQAALEQASPALREAIKDIPIDRIHLPTLERHLLADRLGMQFTEGQATQDIVKLSNEQNRRAKDTQFAYRFQQQEQHLRNLLDVVKDEAAPNVYGPRTIDNSENIINSYKTLDKARQDDINAKYLALRDANGGEFPINGKLLAENAEKLLKKQLKTEFLSPSIKSQLERFKNGEQMTFENFEALRTNLATEMRRAERNGDGNAKAAASAVRQALEDLPLTGSASEQLKPLADAARKAAQERFKLLESDPAYNAAVYDSVAPDKFLDKFVIKGNNKDLIKMIEQLGVNSEAHENMRAGAINWIKERSGAATEAGTLSQAAYHKALLQLDKNRNFDLIFDPQSKERLKDIGAALTITQKQPKGSFVNTSNTFVASLGQKAAEKAKDLLESGVNVATAKTGIKVGTGIRNFLIERAAQEETRKALELGAGLTYLKDIGKKD